MGIVTLTTDFALADDCVAAVNGEVLRAVPGRLWSTSATRWRPAIPPAGEK